MANRKATRTRQTFSAGGRSRVLLFPKVNELGARFHCLLDRARTSRRGARAPAGQATATDGLERANPLRPIPVAPLGSDIDLKALKEAPAPARIRLGRWLFYDVRLSGDRTVSCATCHISKNGFSIDRAFAIGVGGQGQSSLFLLAEKLIMGLWREGKELRISLIGALGALLFTSLSIITGNLGIRWLGMSLLFLGFLFMVATLSGILSGIWTMVTRR